MNTLVIQYDPSNANSEILSAKLGVPLIGSTENHDGLLLSYQHGRLTLSRPLARDVGTVCVDFCDARLSFRLTQALSREAVVKAVGGCVSQRSGLHRVIDATAGLGQDAFILAAAGWHVTLIEQSPVIHALLTDGLQRARSAVVRGNDSDQLSRPAARPSRLLGDILERMHLCDAGDSADLLPTLAPAAAIYLDPMFPTREKAARVKKNRFLLQQLHGTEGAGQGLLPLALGLTAKVVVKRPRLAQPLENLVPTSSLSGKTSRFDIYVGNGRMSAE